MMCRKETTNQVEHALPQWLQWINPLFGSENLKLTGMKTTQVLLTSARGDYLPGFPRRSPFSLKKSLGGHFLVTSLTRVDKFLEIE